MTTIRHYSVSGIHDAYCKPREGREGEKWWWHPDETGDLWPHEPVLYLRDEQEKREWQERMEKGRAAFAKLRDEIAEGHENGR